MSDLIWHDATAQAEAIRGGTASATELVWEHLARIDRFDPVLRAYVSVDADRALDTAREDDAVVKEADGADLPPFLGVPISLKDVIDVEGLPTTHSCKVLADHVAAPTIRSSNACATAGFTCWARPTCRSSARR